MRRVADAQQPGLVPRSQPIDDDGQQPDLVPVVQLLDAIAEKRHEGSEPVAERRQSARTTRSASISIVPSDVVTTKPHTRPFDSRSPVTSACINRWNVACARASEATK